MKYVKEIEEDESFDSLGYSPPVREDLNFQCGRLGIEIGIVRDVNFSTVHVSDEKDVLNLGILLSGGIFASYQNFTGEYRKKILDFCRIDELKDKRWYYATRISHNPGGVYLLRPVLPEDEAEEPTIDPAKLDISIDDLGLSHRAYCCMKKTGLLTVGDIIQYKPETLLLIHRLGKKTLAEIEEILGMLRLALKGQSVKIKLDKGDYDNLDEDPGPLTK